MSPCLTFAVRSSACSVGMESCVPLYNCTKHYIQDAQLSQRDRATLGVIEILSAAAYNRTKKSPLKTLMMIIVQSCYNMTLQCCHCVIYIRFPFLIRMFTVLMCIVRSYT